MENASIIIRLERCTNVDLGEIKKWPRLFLDGNLTKLKLKLQERLLHLNKIKNKKVIILDWNSFLHSLWLGIMKTNPGFYDDAIASTIVKSSLREVRKQK